ncbi:glycosyltransferase family A protein [Agrococcus sp. TF02-05]|uniref:glycosyltransferase family 2 protein n=1 Tax=Agrococcus sp. TF02-05 TaxID=2815211 RepID=UPI001AA0F3F4|nr:glycosyltransferase family A protein [Agrococcus sp. TF02-05]MBO1770695.1 glycosyltransferase family 2 protein [Agrococcus sp. TF02-05]
MSAAEARSSSLGDRARGSGDVAVIVRTKDRPLLLARALASIDGQSLRPRQLVVVNDGGEPTAVEAALDAVRTTVADEVVVVHHDAPVGRPRGMNVGVRASSASAFVFHDDDDSWAPAFLETSLAHLDGNQADAAVATRTAVVFERVEGERIVELAREVYQADTASVTLTETLYRNATPPICLVYRRSAYDEVGGYDDALTALADWEFLLRVLRIATVGFVDGEPLAFWHHRRDDLSATGNSAYADAGAHAAFNAGIRDGYLRRTMAEVDDLGAALFVADGFRRIDEKADAARAEASRVAQSRDEAQREHLEAVHAALVHELVAIHASVGRLQDEVAELRRLASRSAGARLREAGASLGGRVRRRRATPPSP